MSNVMIKQLVTKTPDGTEKTKASGKIISFVPPPRPPPVKLSVLSGYMQCT